MLEVEEQDKFGDHLFASGHTACPGCGQSLAARLVLRAAGRNVIVVNSTGCLEVFSSKYPESAWEVPWLHSLFENTAAVAAGIEAALKINGQLDKVRVIAQGGDGSTADIGLGAISGMFERGHDVLYICYDNEAYMNTGIQRSGLTPYYARTTTSPPGRVSMGNWRPKKDVPQIAVAHEIPYVATASVGYHLDLDRKIRRALSIRGPKYMQIHVPCPLGWGSDPAHTIDIARLAVNTGLYPLYEVEEGETKVQKIPRKVPVEEYLKLQTRFRHLFGKNGGKKELEEIQRIADRNIEKYGLIGK
ncbi:MAG TPA: pyruvate ferredoxin oxidoreductase [Dehalococcoidia bacterium]|nr:pyruvate ferredoxin oxidoreductase [Dehalococcoidia bacterium]